MGIQSVAVGYGESCIYSLLRGCEQIKEEWMYEYNRFLPEFLIGRLCKFRVLGEKYL